MNASDPRFARIRQQYQNALENMQTGTYKGSGDVIDWSMWDRFTIDGTTPTLQHRMFVQGLGTPGRTMADTNVRGAQGGIPTGSKLYARAIVTIYQTDEARTEAECQAIADVLTETTFQFKIEGKGSYGEWCFDQMMGVPFTGGKVAAAVGESFSNGRFVGILPLNLPIVLASQTSFEGLVDHHVAPSSDLDGDKLKVCLVGILERLS
jgi:hypothetical protein